MEFRNHTPFPALAFDGLDQHGQEFHVVVVRQTLDITPAGLVYADEQAPLCEVDEWLGESNRSPLYQESDLCQYKPRCDVVVHGTAHAPGGKAARSWNVRLQMRKPDQPIPMPEAPQGLNPYMAPSPERVAAWQQACDAAKGQVQRGETLIDKTLVVTGERSLRAAPWPLPWLASACRWLSLGLLRPIPWRLTRAAPATRVSIQVDRAFGGDCCVKAGEPAADRLPRKLRGDSQAQVGEELVHTAYQANPAGRGWVEDWYVRATRAKHLPAPQIEHPGKPFQIGDFWRAMRGKPPSVHLQELATFGPRAKAHPARARLVGTVDQAFIKGGQWLPQDFDFAVWNLAPQDQQIDFPQGGEIIELTNLCAASAHGVQVDKAGNTLLRFAVPEHQAFVRVRLQSGEFFRLPMQFDTLHIDTDKHQVTLVWRRIVGKLDDAPIRVLEVGLLSPQQRAERDAQMTALDDAAARRQEAAHA